MGDHDDAGAARVTMKDVALAAGVSQSTVSFVLNGNDDMRISAETRRRVLRAVADLGYRPRGAGRPPKAAGTRVIGVMFDEVATSPFAAISIEGVQEEAWNSGVLVEVVMTGGDRSYEAAVLRKWAADRVEGVIYASILTRRVTPPDALARHRAVLLNCYDPEESYASVVPAERAAERPPLAPCWRPGTGGSPSFREKHGWMPPTRGWRAMSAHCAPPT